MNGSVGEIKLPIVSTFDPAGTTAAKAAMKDLEQAGRNNTGGGGGARPPAAGGGGGAAGAFAKMPGMDALKGLTGEMGIGNPAAMLSKVATPMTAAATGATAFFVAMQKSAAQAREIRIESEKLGVSSKYYRDLAWNAREVGISMQDAAAGIEKVQGKAGAAITGDIASQAYFASLGIGQGQLQGMSGDNGALATMVARRGSGAQQLQGFGSLEAAKAAGMTSNYDSGYGRAKNDALEASNLKLQDLPGKALDTANSFFGALSYHFQKAGRAYGGGMSFSDAEIEMNKEAKEKDAKEALDRRNAARAEAGTKFGVGLLNANESLKSDAASEKNYDYSQMTALTGISGDTFHARAQTQRMQKQQAFDSQFQNPYERQAAQGAIIGRQTAEGTLTGTQGYRAAWSNFDQTAAAVSGTRSNAENLRNQMTSFGGKWNDPVKDKDVQRDAARDFGDKLTDAVEGMTKSGPLAGANDMNSVAGYSQLVQAEYGMDQSKDTVRMVELLVKIAENTGKMTTDQGNAVLGNLGFRTADPILGGQ